MSSSIHKALIVYKPFNSYCFEAFFLTYAAHVGLKYNAFDTSGYATHPRTDLSIFVGDSAVIKKKQVHIKMHVINMIDIFANNFDDIARISESFE